MVDIIFEVAGPGLRHSIDTREIGNNPQVRILSSPPEAPHLFNNMCGAFTVLYRIILKVEYYGWCSFQPFADLE